AYGPARVVLDRATEHAAIHGLVRALEETRDRVFVLGVDLPAVSAVLVRAIAERSLASDAAAVVPRADGRLQPLAAVWRRSVLPAAERRIAAGDRWLRALAREVGAVMLEEGDWRGIDPSGT